MFAVLAFYIPCFGGVAQAQIQNLEFSGHPHSMQSLDKKKPSLFVKKQKTQEGSALPHVEDADAEESAPKEPEQLEIDRVFEKYRQMAQQQEEAAAQKPIKTEASKTKRPVSPDRPSLEPRDEAPKGGFSSILEKYQQGKSERSGTQSLKLTDPSKFIKEDDKR